MKYMNYDESFAGVAKSEIKNAVHSVKNVINLLPGSDVESLVAKLYGGVINALADISDEISHRQRVIFNVRNSNIVFSDPDHIAHLSIYEPEKPVTKIYWNVNDLGFNAMDEVIQAIKSLDDLNNYVSKVLDRIPDALKDMEKQKMLSDETISNIEEILENLSIEMRGIQDECSEKLTTLNTENMNL